MFNSVLLATAIFVLCDGASIIEKDKRCSISDQDCLRSIFSHVLNIVTKDGLPDFGIPRADPYKIKDLNMLLLGLINMTVTDGEVKGFKTCYNTGYKVNLEAGLSELEIICDVLNIEGNYVGESTPALLAIIGGINVHGKGSGVIGVDKVKVNLDLAFDMTKHDDGEVYFKVKPEESSYKYEVLGNLKVDGNGVYVGKQDISELAVNIANENGKVFIKLFGKTFFDKTYDIIIPYIQKFFENVAAKELVTDDLSSYVK